MSNELAKHHEPIRGKVAGILNERELVINVGADSGVQAEMKFKVLSVAETEVYDPDTDELLGLIDREKVRVRVTEVKEKLSVCRTYRVFHTPAGPLYTNLFEAGGIFRMRELMAAPRKIPETLKAGGSDYLPPLSEEESFVKVGDRVIQLYEDD